MMKNLYFIGLIAISIASCSNNHDLSDAYGTFETSEIMISAEGSGKLLLFNVEEGKSIKAGEKVGLIDTIALSIQRAQLEAKREAVATKVDNVLAQIAVLKEQKSTLITEKERLEKLLEDGAATTKQMDDINGKLSVTDKQIQSVETQNAGIINETKAIDKQIELMDYQIDKCEIINPVQGVVLEKYAEQYELVATGKPLYKIADLQTMYLRIYVSGSRLPGIYIGQKVEVLTDKDSDTNQALEGTVCWISSQAEFTPKIIQTKEERVNLVYAVKIKAVNDGRLKIGMPGEANFKNTLIE